MNSKINPLAHCSVYAHSGIYLKKFFIVRNEVAKVMFLHVCVCPQGGLPKCMLGYQPPRRGTPGAGIPSPTEAGTPWSRHPPEQAPLRAGIPQSRHPPEQGLPRSRHPRPDTCCCGRHIFYWNAFLFKLCINTFRVLE